MSATVPRMNAEQARAWMALVSASHLVPAALDHQLTEDAGLISFEYGILSALNVAPDQTLRIGDIVAAIGAPYPRVSKAVTRLDGRGLVERVACAEDGRAMNIHLTRAGRRLWLSVTPPHMELARDTILGGFTPAELEMLASLLGTVIARLDPEGTFGKLPKNGDPPTRQ